MSVLPIGCIALNDSMCMAKPNTYNHSSPPIPQIILHNHVMYLYAVVVFQPLHKGGDLCGFLCVVVSICEPEQFGQSIRAFELVNRAVCVCMQLILIKLVSCHNFLFVHPCQVATLRKPRRQVPTGPNRPGSVRLPPEGLKRGR